jgi:hypothetical protein
LCTESRLPVSQQLFEIISHGSVAVEILNLAAIATLAIVG